MSSTPIEIASVTKRFGAKTAVSDLSLSVPAGTFLGLLGRNGAGKSTLIKMIIGLMKPTAGTIRVLGRDSLEGDLDVKRRLGVMPEGTALLERLTGPQYLQFVGRLYGLEDRVISERRAELFDLLELQAAPGAVLADYSYGMKKKTALSAALLHGPEILLLDEPFEGVDPVSSRTIKNLLLGLNRKGTTILLTSHALDLVERLCPVLAIIELGKLVGHGTLAELQATHGQSASLEALFMRLMGSEQKGELSWS